MMNHPLESLLVIGSIDCPQMRWAFQQSESLQIVDDCDAAKDWLGQANALPPLMVIAASRPGTTSKSQVNSLRRAAPMTPIVAVVGSWFEGDRRGATRDLAVPLYYWHQWPGVFLSGQQAYSEGKLPLWALPGTYQVDELVQWGDQFEASKPAKSSPFVAVYGDDADGIEVLTLLLDQSGYKVAGSGFGPQDMLRGADAVVCDLSSCDPHHISLLESIVAAHPGVPTLAITSFPRKQDLTRFLGLGIQTTLAKPFTHDEFLGQLGSLLASRTLVRAA